MKKLLLICIAASALLFTSCSDDDSSGTNNNSPLINSTQKIYENGDLDEIVTSEYDNGKLIKLSSYTPDQVLMGYTKLQYNSSGLLVSSQNYTAQVLYSTTTYSYDSQQRMTDIITEDAESNILSTITYTYSADSTITGAFSQSGYNQTKTFYLNDAGYVYKQVTNSGTFELTYNGTTPVSALSNGSTTTFEYDETHDFSLLNINLGPGNFKPNVVLRAGNLPDAINTIANKYMTAQNSGSQVTTYNYIFNEQGLPTKKSDYYNGELRSEMEFFYN